MEMGDTKNPKTPNIWNEIDKLITTNNSDAINALLVNESDSKKYYDA